MNKLYILFFLYSLVVLQGCDHLRPPSEQNIGKITIYKKEDVPFDHKKNSVLIGGCFDILHHGHIQFIQKAKAEGEYLIVALEPDEKIMATKKRNPIHNADQRASNLIALRAVDEVILLPVLKTYGDYLAFVKSIHPSILAITADDPQQRNKRMQAQAIQAELKVVVPRLGSFSSTQILKKCQHN